VAVLHLLFSGARFIISAYGEDEDRCEVRSFLEDRQLLNASDERSFQALFAWHGNHGPIRNKTKCNFLGEGLFEYKAPGGGRIAWFYDHNSVVICACGTVKKKQKADPAFIAKARKIQERYSLEKANGKVRHLF
jgi:hypothetical protein